VAISRIRGGLTSSANYSRGSVLEAYHGIMGAVGTFFHAFTLIGASGDVETLDGLVDTGSTFTTVPRPLLEGLGVNAFARIRLRLANGEPTEADVGEVSAQILDLVPRTIICAFGEPGAPTILGAHALEAFLLGVEPVEKKLVPVEGWQAAT
jgi:predicted aspartyl protease